MGAKKGTTQSGIVRDYPWLAEQRGLRQQRAQEFEDESRERIGAGRAFVEPSLYSAEGFGERIGESSYGRGREGYETLSRTGGFTPESESVFIRSAINPYRAVYSAARRNIERGRTLQGGYSPSFGAGEARLTRHAGQAMSEGRLVAQAELEAQKRSGILSGLGGLERTRASAGQEALQRVGMAQQGIQHQDVLRLQSRIQSGQL